jgi:hypothetical protein
VTATATGHKSLLEALLAFQAEAPVLPKDKTNPHYKSKFTGLDTIVEKVGPLLVKHGLVWMAFPARDEQGPCLRYQLAHAATKESVDGSMPLLLTKSDPQGQGSALTYARRYAITTVLNLVADEDDDGNTASQPAAKPKATPLPGISAQEVDTLIQAATDAGVRDKLQLAASHAHGDDIGDCSTDKAAKDALLRLTVPEAMKVADWIQKKTAEAPKASEAKDVA